MRHDRRSGGWITTVLALAALVVVGFVAGALAGFLWEEPGLVIAYLSGETEAVEWSEPGPVAAEPPPLEADTKLPMAPPPTPAVREAPPEPEQVARAAPAPRPAEKPAAAKEVAKPAPAPTPAKEVAKPAPAPTPAKEVAKPAPVAVGAPGSFAVQVGAFGESRAAENLADRLRSRGYRTYVRASTEDGISRWRVRVGPVSTRTAAEELAGKLQRGEKLPTWVLDEGEG